MMYIFLLIISYVGCVECFTYVGLGSHENKTASIAPLATLAALSKIHCAILCDSFVLCVSFTYNFGTSSSSCNLYSYEQFTAASFDIEDPGRKTFKRKRECPVPCTNNYTLSMHIDSNCVLVNGPVVPNGWIAELDANDPQECPPLLSLWEGVGVIEGCWHRAPVPLSYKSAFLIYVDNEDVIVTSGSCSIDPEVVVEDIPFINRIYFAIYQCLSFYVWSSGNGRLTIEVGSSREVIYNKDLQEPIGFVQMFASLDPNDSSYVQFLGRSNGNFGIVKATLSNCPCSCLQEY